MITTVNNKKMVIISDLHLGNPFSSASRRVIQFMHWAAHEGYDICINGDGLEIAQASFSKISLEVPEFLRALGQIRRKGVEVFYTVGNHDVALEHFLEDWGMMKVTPFLNVHSGDARIRIEHGHLYDPFFVTYPRLYEVLTRVAMIPLMIHPSAYKLWIWFEKLRSKFRARKTGIVGEPLQFRIAAQELADRGFDAVVFGHTHHPGEVELNEGKRYYNPGSWLLSTHYVEILDGVVSLKVWDPKLAVRQGV